MKIELHNIIPYHTNYRKNLQHPIVQAVNKLTNKEAVIFSDDEQAMIYHDMIKHKKNKELLSFHNDAGYFTIEVDYTTTYDKKVIHCDLIVYHKLPFIKNNMKVSDFYDDKKSMESLELYKYEFTINIDLDSKVEPHHLYASAGYLADCIANYIKDINTNE